MAKPAHSAAGNTSSTSAAGAKAPTADELLRARLDAVMQEAEVLRSSRSAIASATIGTLPQARIGATAVTGRLAPEKIQKVVRANFGTFRLCYEEGLRKDPNLQGRVGVRFVIGRDGKVTNVGNGGSDMPDSAVVSCVLQAFYGLSFPEPEGGIVTVVYPIRFSPGDDSSASQPPAPPPAPPAAPPALVPPAPTSVTPSKASASIDEDGESDSGPIVVIEGSGVRVGGVIVGDTQAIIEADRLMKLDALFDELKAWREAWKTNHPGKPFVGAAGLRVDPNTPQIVLKSVFQTIAFAGYPDIFVQSAANPQQISELIAQVPLPPGPPDPNAPAEPVPVLNMHISRDEVALIWKRASTVFEEKRVARNDPSLGTAICESWKEFGRHPEVTDTRRDAVVIHSDNGLAWQVVEPVTRAAESCTREVLQPDGRKERMPVFWTIFSVR